MIITITLVSFLVIYLIFRKAKRAKADKALIEFKIGTTDGFYYNVEPEKVPINIDSNERIRVMLGFISQLLLYTASTNNPEKTDILKFIKEVLRKELSQEAIIRYFKREFAFELNIREAKVDGKVIVGEIFQIGDERRFQAKIPSGIFKYQLLFSIASLLHLVVGKLSDTQKSHLQQSLRYIADFYFHNIFYPMDSSKISNLENKAYLAGLPQHAQEELKFG